jgi:AcrR family transcriptional regulator
MGSVNDENAGVKRRTGTGREALIEAAKRLLPDRAPGTIAGRDLAVEADVNYGLVHHYFGGKDEALRAGLRALRDDFVTAHGDVTAMPLVTSSDPYLKALVRWHLHESDRLHDSDQVDGEFPLGAALVEAVASRLDSGDDHSLAEAKARAIAMSSLQLCFAVFGPALLEATGVRDHERPSVEAALASLYDSIALRDRSPTGPPAHRT